MFVGVYFIENMIHTPITEKFPIPTLSRSFAAMPFQSTPVGWFDLAIFPPNPAAYLHVGVWDKTWDKYANYFETVSPQFHFCPRDKNGLVLRPGTT